MYIEPVFFVNGAFYFPYTYNFHAPLILRNGGGVRTYVTQPLDHHGFAFDPRLQPQLSHIFFIATGFADTVEYAPAGGFRPAPDTVLVDGLAGDTTGGVDIIAIEGSVGIVNPGHFAGARSIIRRRNIHRGPDHISADEF